MHGNLRDKYITYRIDIRFGMSANAECRFSSYVISQAHAQIICGEGSSLFVRNAMRGNEGRKVESVWDYPRPPRVVPSSSLVRVVFNGIAVAETRLSIRVLETSHPPTYYIPPGDVRREYLPPTDRTSFCEFKGVAAYYSVRVNERVAENAAWSYHSPTSAFVAIRDYLAFYPGRMDACYVDGERVQAQEGDFYGGWITSDIRGPFKGAPGTSGW
jgi:uncharacterized protein (DUF427 family)